MGPVDLGWNESWRERFAPFGGRGWTPARVIVEHRSAYCVATEHGEIPAVLAGHFRHRAATASDLPVVGDWVSVHIESNGDVAMIHSVVPRRTWFSRKVPGRAAEEQILAANVDLALIVTAFGSDFSLRRLERYLVLARQTAIEPVVVLNKADLALNAPDRVDEAMTVAESAPVVAVSAVRGDGLEQLRSLVAGGGTAVCLGSSGVGKTSLINRLVGGSDLAVQSIRVSDGKGRHTTTRRQLIRLPGGGVILDTPGLREVQLWEASDGVERSFQDIEELAQRCRFGDCRHESEPGCAVRKAVDSGALDVGRLESFLKLNRELRHLEMRTDQRAQAASRRKMKSVHKNLRAIYRERDRPG